MLIDLLSEEYTALLAGVGILLAFAGTVLCLSRLSFLLPRDAGRDYAVEGKMSAGKPRGAGIIFVLVFAVAALFFSPFAVENLIYLILLIICMMTGFLDDASSTPWGEYRKGFLDLCVAVMVAVTYLRFNSSVVELALFDVSFELPPVVFALGVVVLVWVSVNVTNCADGVDGLSGTLAIITLMTIYCVDLIRDVAGDFSYLILLFVVCLLGYLWYNATPSRLMMGDAGSRAMGLFISIAVLKTGCPFLYIPVALVILLDGGLGLLKVALLRFFKIHILTNVKCPLHDHVRKTWGWSNTQTVYRFGIIQIILGVALLYGILL